MFLYKKGVSRKYFTTGAPTIGLNAGFLAFDSKVVTSSTLGTDFASSKVKARNKLTNISIIIISIIVLS